VEENQIEDERTTRPGLPASLATSPAPIVTTGSQVAAGAISQRASGFQGSLTSHGELCTDACDKRGYPYFWCHKASSSLGQWWDSDFCSPFPSVTQYGKECSNACEQRGEAYFWCNRVIDGGWGYCSPDTVYREGICDQGDGFYALLGDCQR